MRSLRITLAAALFLLAGCTGDTITSVENEEPLAVTQDEVAAKKVPAGMVMPLLSLPPGDSPEGIAFDKRGNIYVSNRRTSGNDRISEILKITRRGQVSLFATLPTAMAGVNGVLGLIVDPPGNVYFAYDTRDPATHGVWRIRRNGRGMERLAGSDKMIMPNALTFDARGNLYATDSFGGAVWRYGQDEVFSMWLQDPLLEAVPVPGAPIPIPGANGIAFYPPNKLYVANTSQNSVICILIDPDGGVRGITRVAQDDFLLLNVDGIAMDVQENIYSVLPPSTLGALGLPPVPPVVKLDPHSGVVMPVVTDPSAFDTPTSLAFGAGPWDRKSVFIVNASLFGPGLGAGPGVVQVRIGVPGAPGK